ncbi:MULTISPECIES: hypothetical protein [Pseudomonas]|uniref:hypothetical protein n=1 Tax=Pseudomonas TaxID=286 RepID=UPI001485A404|nr:MULTISPECIES: hypothetical protein [Pseudomonas]
MNKLSFIPLPGEDESSISLMYRCCEKNGYRTLLDINRQFHLRMHTPGTCLWKGCRSYKLLTDQDQVTAEEADKIATAFFEIKSNGRDTCIVYKGINFSGHSLRQNLALCLSCCRSGMLNNMHMFNWSDTCPIHHERYITSCPACLKPLNWLELRDYHCTCGHDLRMSSSVVEAADHHELISQALASHDSHFFNLAEDCIAAFQHFRTTNNNSVITNSCFQIASGGRQNFFEAIGKIQELYPSLHRRAILTPLLCSKNEYLRTHAIQYLYQAQQSKPQSHDPNCDCSKINFRFADAITLTCSIHNRAQLISEGLLEIDPTAPKYRCLTHSGNLCEMLWNISDVQWDTIDCLPDSKQEANLITLNDASSLLEIPITYVATFAKAGYFKSLKLLTHKQALVSMQEVQQFANTYITAAQIAKTSGLSYRHIHSLLASSPCEVVMLPFRLQIKIYYRASIPESLTQYLDKSSNSSLEALAESVMTFADAAVQLDLDVKDMRLLADMGIIEAKFYRGKSDAPTRKYCVGSSLPSAITWRSNFIKLHDLAKKMKCSAKMALNLYIKTNFVPYTQLISSILVTKSDAEKVIEHHEKYITLREAHILHKLFISELEDLIKHKVLIPLSRSDKDYLNGLITIPKQELLDWMATKYTTEKGIQRICRQRKIQTDI